jgi:predicted AlkP superfamily pyrophosphatase or phosphodiesterase
VFYARAKLGRLSTLIQVLIIGLDGLEHSLVEDYDLKNLKQMEYGKVDLLMKKDEEPLTPTIWCNFITGETPDVHGVVAIQKWKYPLLEKIYASLRSFDVKHRGYWRGVLFNLFDRMSLFEMRGMRDFFTREDINCDTIFDDMDSTIAISIPSFNEDEINKELRRLVVEGRKFELKKRAHEAFVGRRKRFLNALNQKPSLLMVHFFLLDLIQHMFPYDTEYIKKTYEKMDGFVGKVTEKLSSNEVFLLIVSDHGLLNGYHTPYGFYSSNEKLNLRNPKITDFTDIIRRKLGVPSKQDAEKIKKRLLKLGYM